MDGYHTGYETSQRANGLPTVAASDYSRLGPGSELRDPARPSLVPRTLPGSYQTLASSPRTLQWKHDVGGADLPMMDGLVRFFVCPVSAQRSARVGVDVESGPVAAADVQADTMPFPEHVRCRVELED